MSFRRLGALTLEQKRLYADMVIVYKVIYGLLGCSLTELGLQLVSSNTRGAKIRLTQRKACSKFMKELLCA